MTEILEIDSVILEFDNKRILHDVYLKCETGKVSGLLGRNGTGKTCLMKIIYGELLPNDKSIRVNGKFFSYESSHSSTIRFLPQFGFVPKPLTIRRIFSDFDLPFAKFTVHFPDFNRYYDENFGSLSTGEQRIIEIYSILMSKAKFCMLDEPFSQVMPLHIDIIKMLILQEKQNKGIIVTDHLYQHIIDICDNLYVINNGKIYLTSTLQDIETLGYAKIYNDSVTTND